MSKENANVTCMFPEGSEDLYHQEEATAQHCGHTGSYIKNHSGVQNILKGDDFYLRQVFILAQSQTSLRKTSNISKNSYTNFLEKQKRIADHRNSQSTRM